MKPMPRLFLGLDSSTQSLSAVIIDLDQRKVIYEKSLNFDRALPEYKTRNGVLPTAIRSSNTVRRCSGPGRSIGFSRK